MMFSARLLDYGREERYIRRLKTRFAMEQKMRAHGLPEEGGPGQPASDMVWMSEAQVRFYYPITANLSMVNHFDRWS